MAQGRGRIISCEFQLPKLGTHPLLATVPLFLSKSKQSVSSKAKPAIPTEAEHHSAQKQCSLHLIILSRASRNRNTRVIRFARLHDQLCGRAQRRFSAEPCLFSGSDSLLVLRNGVKAAKAFDENIKFRAN